MRSKPIIPRERAHRDIDDAVDYYLREGAPQAALGLIAALEQAFSYIGNNPDSGSLRYSGILDIPNLRFWSLKRYPHLVFYLEHADHIDVWRVLHAERDIPAWMLEHEGP